MKLQDLKIRAVGFDMNGTLIDKRDRFFPGAVELVRALHAQGMLLALVTDSKPYALTQSFPDPELLELFSLVLPGGFGGNPRKPDPAVWKEALRMLGNVPTLALENEPEGISSAVQAGCAFVCGIDFKASPAKLRSAGANHVVSNYYELAEFLDIRL